MSLVFSVFFHQSEDKNNCYPIWKAVDCHSCLLHCDWYRVFTERTF